MRIEQHNEKQQVLIILKQFFNVSTEYPNPNIETRIRVKSIGAYSKSKKYVTTLLVVRLFLDLLSVLRGCAIYVFSMSGFRVLDE